MRFSRGNLAVGGAAILLCAFVLTNTAGSQAQEPEGNFGVGIPDVFLPKYLNYRARQLSSSTPHVMRVPLGNVKGLSRSFTSMRGEMAVNLQSGAYNLTLNGLTPLHDLRRAARRRVGRPPAARHFVRTGHIPGGGTIDRSEWTASAEPAARLYDRSRPRDAGPPPGHRTIGVGVGERLPEAILQAPESGQ